MTLGQSIDGHPIKIDLDRLVEGRLMLQANSGAGKSWALRRLLEQTHGKIQHIVIDVEDEFHTLREKHDYILAGRDGGDCPADSRSAELLARRLLELGMSAVISIYEMKPDERAEFVALFLQSLISAPRALWHPVLVVLDEAHMFAPEGGKSESTGAVVDLMARGRKRGFTGVLATQRISKINKDAIAEINNKLIGRAALDLDMKRSADELGFFGRDSQLRLRTLPAGTFFAFGPALSPLVTEMHVGPVVTTHPKPGQRSAPPTPPPNKVKAVLAQLANLPQEAEAEARSIEELHRKIRSLEGELRQARSGQPDPEHVQRLTAAAENAARADAERRWLDETQSQRKEIGRLLSILEKVHGLTGGLESVAILETKPLPQATRYMAHMVQLLEPASKPTNNISNKTTSSITHNGNSDLARGERKILTVLAQYPMGRTKVQVAILAGYAHSGGGFNNYLSALRSKGFLVGSDPLEITKAGVTTLGNFEPLPFGKDLLRFWLGSLSKAERLILEALALAYPRPLPKEEIASRTGYEASGGGFNNAISKLRTLELIEGRGELKASETFFEL